MENKEPKYIKVKEPMVNPLEAKETRADFTYYPKCSPISDVMCLPRFKDKKDYNLMDTVLKHYQETRI